MTLMWADRGDRFGARMVDRVRLPGTYGRLAGLPVEVEEIELRRLTYTFAPMFTRVTTCIVLRGRGSEGEGEDVTPFEAAHEGVERLGAEPGMRGAFTLAMFGRRLAELDLYPGVELPPGFPRTFRGWGFEGAALDLGEIGPGRAQNQYLASLFHPDAPNDLAPVPYNEAELAPELPASPLVVSARETGFTPAWRA